jgi:hypothetical protein
MSQPGPGRHPAVRGPSLAAAMHPAGAGAGGPAATVMIGAMADTSETAASLRVTRVTALSSDDRLHLLTYLLAKYPDSFSEMLDEALSAVSPGGGRGKDEA